MYIDILVDGNPNLIEFAQAVLKSWAKEHAAYYARVALAVGEGRTTTYCGMRPIPGGAIWLTSGNNAHIVECHDGNIRLTYAGRRHGMRPEFAKLLQDAANRFGTTVLAYQTQKPTWAPWETNDDHNLDDGAGTND